MSRYQISVEVKIQECDATVDANPVEQAEGSFRLVISEQTASSIDACEQALLHTNYAAVRQALAAHLSALSKKTMVRAKAKVAPPSADLTRWVHLF